MISRYLFQNFCSSINLTFLVKWKTFPQVISKTLKTEVPWEFSIAPLHAKIFSAGYRVLLNVPTVMMVDEIIQWSVSTMSNSVLSILYGLDQEAENRHNSGGQIFNTTIFSSSYNSWNHKSGVNSFSDMFQCRSWR